MNDTLGNQDLLVDAAFRGDLTRVKDLIAAGVDVNADGTNWNPLHAAVENMEEEAVRFLLEAGADPNHMCWGCPPLHHAIDIEIDAVHQSLQRTPTPEELPDPSITRILLAHGADAELRDSCGETPHTFAFRRGHHLAAKLLLEWKNAEPGQSSELL